MGMWINATITNTAGAPQDKVTSAKVPNTHKYIIIHNPDAAASLAFTLDGTVPVVNSNGVTLFPGGTTTLDQYSNNGALSMISSAASQSATIMWR